MLKSFCSKGPHILFFAIAAISLGGLHSANATDIRYKESSCYKEFSKVYQDAVRGRLENLRFRQGLALETGIVLNSPSSDSWGEEEKSIVNAADLRPSYNPSAINNESSLNAFSYVHHKVLEEFPDISPYQTREYIRKGFEEGEFCSKFLFIKFRSSRRKVAKWIVGKIQDDMESSSVLPAEVSDTEINKDYFFTEETQDQDGSEARTH